MLKFCCNAALSAALVAPVIAWGQEKPAERTVPSRPATKAAAPSVGTKSPKPAAGAPSKVPVEKDSEGVRAIEAIFACVAQGLPQGWQRAWVTVTELSSGGAERTFEGRFTVSLDDTGDKRWDFVPCNARDVAERVYALNEFLAPEKRQWKVATLLFSSAGRFELKYDYTR